MDQKALTGSAILALLAAWMPASASAQPQPGSAADAVIAAPPAASNFLLSPKNGQNDEQQWFDRYACDSQARRLSGYDPINEQHGPSQQAAGEEYLRAMTACLTQHGYEVRYAPPESPSPPSPSAYQSPPRQRPDRELRYRPLSVQLGGGYSIAAGSTADYIHGGPNAGAALNWFPTAALPIGVRVEGSYMWSKAASQLLAVNGIGYTKGDQDLYGGDVDLRLNLSRLPTRQRFYLAAGVGWYRTDTTLQKLSGGGFCGTRFCGVIQSLVAEEQDKSPWELSWNAGLGWEIALDSHTAFFLETRYRYIRRYLYGGGTQLVPVWLGLRF